MTEDMRADSQSKIDAEPAFSVVIPAHNEAQVIDRCLGALLDGAPNKDPAAYEIIVVCNGCTDDTAERAAAFGPCVRVIELEQGSKPLALNTGNSAARFTPRFFVDADIVVSYHALTAAARPLAQEQALAAAPALALDFEHSDWIVRAFHRVWMKSPYVRFNMVGSGVYGLSGRGLDRLGEFPDIISDDMFVHGLFSDGERISIGKDMRGQETVFTAFPPRTLRALIDVEVRRLAGRFELDALLEATPNRAPAEDDTPPRLKSFAPLILNPVNWPDLAAYFYIKAISALNYRAARQSGSHLEWRRDDTTRQALN